MERIIVGALKGFSCAVLMAGLAACNGDGSGSGSTMPASNDSPGTGGATTAHVPPVSTPTEPVNPPSTNNSSSANEPDDSGDDSNEPSQPTNVAPQIAGTPASEVAVGQNFNFTPNASDADGDSLTFSIQSKPDWASFDSSTGHLWGQPAAGDVGSHEEIVISVSDGIATRSLPEFAVDVVGQSNGSAALAWDPPTENTDGSPLTNLKGYRIHYGTQSGSYTSTVTVNSAGVTSYVIENLAPGKYFFAISAITTSGTESDLSGEANKTI